MKLRQIERVIVELPAELMEAKKAMEDVRTSFDEIEQRAYGIAHGLAKAARKRPLTLAEIDMFVEAGCRDLANDIRTGAKANGIPAFVSDAAVEVAQTVFERYFKPLALKIVPIVDPENSIAQMAPKGSA